MPKYTKETMWDIEDDDPLAGARDALVTNGMFQPGVSGSNTDGAQWDREEHEAYAKLIGVMVVN